MSLPSVSGVTGSTGASNTTTSAQTVDYKAFLQLLVTQMKNQDPTAPMDSTDYVAQLATFSQVEQSVQMNEKLDSILQASTFAQAGSLIGKYVSSPDGDAGYVKQVRLFSDGIMAILEDGTQLPIWAGVTITDSPPPPTTETGEGADPEADA